MKRTDVINNLKKVAPALANKEFIPAFCCFTFKDGNVIAYDDVIGIKSQLDIGFNGLVRGWTLIEYLSKSTAPEIEFEANGNSLTIRGSKRSEFKMPLKSLDDALFDFPDTKDADSVEFTGMVLEALQLALMSMGTDPSHPWRLGVSLYFGDGFVVLYSSDNLTMSRCEVDCTVPKKFVGKGMILPPKFCSMAAGTKTKVANLFVSKDSSWVIMKFDNGIEMFTRTINDLQIARFEKVFDNYDRDKIDVVQIPKGLESSLDKALVVLDSKLNKYSKMSVKEDKLHLDTTTPIGEVHDSHSFKGHKEVEVTVPPQMLKRAMKNVDSISLIGDRCVYCEGNGITYLVSVVQGS